MNGATRLSGAAVASCHSAAGRFRGQPIQPVSRSEPSITACGVKPGAYTHKRGSYYVRLYRIRIAPNEHQP